MSENTQIDLELHNKMKTMETAKREESLKDAKVTIITQGSDDNTIDFDTWWMDINRRVTLKPWIKEIIKADFNSRGLDKEEPIERYDETLRLFGFKF